jgi:GNAT superfamily N-acetyltransferase
MSGSRVATQLDVRPYEDADEPRVLELLSASLGAGPSGDRSAAFFRWKHLENPFGRSVLLVAEADGGIVGLRAFLRWRLRAGHRELSAVRAVDTATHPEFQGRGIFSRLTLAAVDALRDQVDLVFNTPNDKSGPGYLKMGWREVGRIPVSIRVRRPAAFARRARTLRSDASPARPAPEVLAARAAEVFADAAFVERALAAAERPDGLATTRSPSYLRWRYAAAPGFDYRAARLDDADGFVVFRVRPRGALWETTVTELVVPPGEIRGARRLLRSVARAAPVDHLALHLPAETTAARAAKRAGYVRAPGGVLFVTNPLRDGLEPDPGRLDSWALTFGDVEVF